MINIIYDTWQVGGIVLVPIVLVGFWGFCLILSTYFELGTGVRRSNIALAFEPAAQEQFI